MGPSWESYLTRSADDSSLGPQTSLLTRFIYLFFCLNQQTEVKIYASVWRWWPHPDCMTWLKQVRVLVRSACRYSTCYLKCSINTVWTFFVSSCNKTAYNTRDKYGLILNRSYFVNHSLRSIVRLLLSSYSNLC